MFCIQLPVYEMTAAIHRLRKRGSASGAKGESWPAVTVTGADWSMGLAGLGGAAAVM